MIENQMVISRRVRVRDTCPSCYHPIDFHVGDDELGGSLIEYGCPGCGELLSSETYDFHRGFANEHLWGEMPDLSDIEWAV